MSKAKNWPAICASATESAQSKKAGAGKLDIRNPYDASPTPSNPVTDPAVGVVAAAEVAAAGARVVAV
jgi:hypothetical protein